MLERQWTGPTRHNPHLALSEWASVLMSVIIYLMGVNYDGRLRKWLSHVGGHFADWKYTDTLAMAKLPSVYRVLENGVYVYIRHRVQDVFWQAAVKLHPAEIVQSMRGFMAERTNAGTLGDVFEVFFVYCLARREAKAFNELYATAFWVRTVFSMGFAEAKRIWSLARKWDWQGNDELSMSKSAWKRYKQKQN